MAELTKWSYKKVVLVKREFAANIKKKLDVRKKRKNKIVKTYAN